MATSDGFWDLDVGVLQVLGFVPAGCALTSKDFVRASRRFALTHHPGKGGDTEFFTSVFERCDRVAGPLADMQDELVASWQPFWDHAHGVFAWRDLQSDRCA